MNHRRAIITGATRGLGHAVAQALAERGWHLILNARTAETLADVTRHLTARTEVYAVAGDIAAPTTRGAIAAAADRIGGVELVINNAGALGPSPLPNLLDLDLDGFRALFDVNVAAQLGLLQAVRPHLPENAVIINVSSDAARGPYPGWGAYGSTKAALDQLSNVLAAENPSWRVYAVDPGDMRTEMHQAAFPGEDISDRPLPEASVPGLLALIEGSRPSGRYESRALGGSS